MAENGNLEIVSFDDACDCISDLLSITDKLIYLVVSATLGISVVPLIHNHRCIEHIYIYQDSDNEESIDWVNDYSKIRANGTSIDLLVGKIKEDIDSIMQRPSRWSRSEALLTELCSQAIQNGIPALINDTPDDDLSRLRIVTLYFDQRRPFHLSHRKIRVDEFHDIEQCIHSIQTDSSTAIFLIISMNRLYDVRSVAELDIVHAVYIVTDEKSIGQVQTMSMYSKVSGIFVLNGDLLAQLTMDICFYRQIRVRTPTTYVFKVESVILGNLDERQAGFLYFQLFSDILLRLPTDSNATADRHTENADGLLPLLIDANMTVNKLFKSFDHFPPHNIASQLKEINQRIVSLAKHTGPSSLTVYRAQLVSQEDLERIHKNLNALLVIQTFVLASKSFRSVSDICRRAVDNQLMVVLFEMNLSERTCVAHLDSDVVVFSLGALFRLVSIDSAPDGVWRAQLESADGAMQCIKNQLQFEIGSRLTWLTFGNYLAALKKLTAAEDYYQYLLRVLTPNHPSRASIYNNIGSMYTMMNNNQKALEWFAKALELNVTDTSMTVEQKHTPIADLPPPADSPIDKITILKKIAEISYRRGDYTTAIDFYRQALEIADDTRSRQFYQDKIDALSNFDDTC